MFIFVKVPEPFMIAVFCFSEHRLLKESEKNPVVILSN